LKKGKEMEINNALRGIFYIAGIVMFISFALLAGRGYIMMEKVEVEIIDGINSLENETITAINETKQNLMSSVDRMEANATKLMNNGTTLISSAENMLEETEIKINKTTDDLSTTMEDIQTSVGNIEQGIMSPMSDTGSLIEDASKAIDNIESVTRDTAKTMSDIKIIMKNIENVLIYKPQKGDYVNSSFSFRSYVKIFSVWSLAENKNLIIINMIC
jgi:predicted transcriptional regulator